MSAFHPLAGVYAAAVTPLKAGGTFDLDGLLDLLRFLVGRGVHGVLLFGTTGEGPSFSPEERLLLWRHAVRIREEFPALRLLAGCGTPSLSETEFLIRSAFDLGFDGVVVLPPYYFRNASEEGLYHWFAHLLRHAVPADGYLLGYHIPNVAGIGFSLELLSRLKDAFPRRFAGLKDSSHDAEFARALGQRFGSDLLVLTGTDSHFQLALENGAQGCITAAANLISPDLRALWDAWRKGEDISPLQERVTHQRHILEKFPPFPPLIKALLARWYDFPRWDVRPPLMPLSPEKEAQVSELWMRTMDGGRGGGKPSTNGERINE